MYHTILITTNMIYIYIYIHDIINQHTQSFKATRPEKNWPTNKATGVDQLTNRLLHGPIDHRILGFGTTKVDGYAKLSDITDSRHHPPKNAIPCPQIHFKDENTIPKLHGEPYIANLTPKSKFSYIFGLVNWFDLNH